MTLFSSIDVSESRSINDVALVTYHSESRLSKRYMIRVNYYDQNPFKPRVIIVLT